MLALLLLQRLELLPEAGPPTRAPAAVVVHPVRRPAARAAVVLLLELLLPDEMCDQIVHSVTTSSDQVLTDVTCTRLMMPLALILVALNGCLRCTTVPLGIHFLEDIVKRLCFYQKLPL